MATYRVTRDYRSSIGQFVAGTTVDIDDDTADWVNRDSPGTLEVPAPVEERAAAVERDRQARPGRNRSR